MARIGNIMYINTVDDDRNLYEISGVASSDLETEILNTAWLDMPWQPPNRQRHLARRYVANAALPWGAEWNRQLAMQWPGILAAIERPEMSWGYGNTHWWVDLPGFVCGIHTDGEMPGAIQIMWIGSSVNLGTVFYYYQVPGTVRYKVPMQSNHGYLMTNVCDQSQYRLLQWHGMTVPVPANTIRVTCYIHLEPRPRAREAK